MPWRGRGVWRGRRACSSASRPGPQRGRPVRWRGSWALRDRGDRAAGHGRAVPEHGVARRVFPMAVTVYIPTPFRRATQNLDRVVTEAHDVGELLDRLEAMYAGSATGARWRGRRPPPRQHLREQRGHRGPRGPGRPAARRRRGGDHPGPRRRVGVILTAEELAAIHAQAVREYPHESCGLVAHAGSRAPRAAVSQHPGGAARQGPRRHPRDARTAYYIDPQDLLRVGRLEGEGFSVAVIYHSHIDAGAYFSETDRRQALLGERSRCIPRPRTWCPRCGPERRAGCR